ncbi:CCA tRNA nucleotidyltransferase [Candidatus Woesearchaeota archaeon]|nr:CCA tRNA nucleotidyltransferase [Candidatus Woesearchaeota archaeon]
MDFMKKLLAENTVALPDFHEVIQKIKAELDKQGVKAEVMVGGSAAKGTYLKEFDIDIFVRFVKKADPDLLEVILKNCFRKVDRVHGSRDYFQIVHKGQEYEIVPVLKIAKASQAQNITDVSMLHVNWVRKHLSRPDEVKLAKLFCKAQSVYGAESYINGLSGYILEILVVYYGGFMKLVENAAKWKPKVVIDVSKYYRHRNDIIKKLNPAKTLGPLIIIDPTQKDRNAAAALSLDTFSKFVFLCREFLKDPKEDWFRKKPVSMKDIIRASRHLGTKLTILKVEPLKGKPDVAFSKLLKAFNYIKNQLQMNDFQVYRAGYDLKEGNLWYMTLPDKLPVYAKQIGPAVWAPQANIDAFLEKYYTTFLEEDKIIAFRKRKFLTAKDFLASIIKTEYVLEKVNKISISKS